MFKFLHNSKVLSFIKIFYKIAFWLNLSGIILFILDFGFNQDSFFQSIIDKSYIAIILSGLSATILRYITHRKQLNTKVLSFDFFSVIVIGYILTIHFLDSPLLLMDNGFLQNFKWIKIAVILTFVRELSAQNINYRKINLNPAQLFITSFLGIILICSFLLMLPNATSKPLEYLDALFTATSAVCVTGLAVVDTGTHFTTLGQSIILLFIQLGGLGILTFASYFSYFFKGGSSYSNQLVLSDMTNSNKIGEVFSTFKRILIITFSIEFIGALLIYSSIPKTIIPSFFERVFFSIFHSISSFCNAGFSTLSNSLFETDYQFNYFLQFNIISLFVLGGLGFPIVINLIKYLKYIISKYIKQLSIGEKAHKPWVLNLNSRITLITTISLSIFGTLCFLFFEYNNTLNNHGWVGKIVTSIFQATTPRTAGFNAVDMTELYRPTILITILLMWIGASPSSTGGGIKTSTFAIATLNFINLGRGRDKIEIYHREIGNTTVRRAFAIITLSLIVIGLGVLLISHFNPKINLLSIIFECFSAYSTAGLSLGITTDLSGQSKFVLIVIMFLGRVSMLSLLIAFMKKVQFKNYRYPSEDILIN